MKQKIILYRYRDCYSERRIARELKINRETVRHYLSEYKKAAIPVTSMPPGQQAPCRVAGGLLPPIFFHGNSFSHILHCQG